MRVNETVEAWSIKTAPIKAAIKTHLYQEAKAWAMQMGYEYHSHLPEFEKWDICWDEPMEFGISAFDNEVTWAVFWDMAKNECVFYRADGCYNSAAELYHG